MKNKKASSLTNPMSIIMILSIVGIFSAIVVNMGVGMNNQEHTNIDQDSTMWLAKETGFKIKNKTMDNGVINENEITEKWYISDETEGENQKDFALEFFFGIEWVSKVFNFFKDLYNLPTFILRWTPLNLEDWSIVINGINAIIWFALGGLVLYTIKGIKT